MFPTVSADMPERHAPPGRSSQACSPPEPAFAAAPAAVHEGVPIVGHHATSPVLPRAALAIGRKLIDCTLQFLDLRRAGPVSSLPMSASGWLLMTSRQAVWS